MRKWGLSSVERWGAYTNELVVRRDVHGLGDKNEFATRGTRSLTSRRCEMGVTYVDLMCWIKHDYDGDTR